MIGGVPIVLCGLDELFNLGLGQVLSTAKFTVWPASRGNCSFLVAGFTSRRFGFAGILGHRDFTMILVAYRHGLRASEVCDLRWEQIDWNSATLHVRRVKSGKPSTHPIRGDELRALRKLQREAPKSPFVFVSERGGPFTTDSFNWLVKRAGQKSGFPFQVHAHMLRHAAGYKLAGDGHDTRSIQDYLGHKNIQHTVRYTELSPTRFKNFWRD